MNINWTYDKVKNEIEKTGKYKLLSTEYKNGTTPLKIQCIKGHVFERPFPSLNVSLKNNTESCRQCMNDQKYKEVKEYIESVGYELLDDTYKGNNEKVKVKCNNSHITHINFRNFKNNGTRCAICSGKKKHSYEYIKTFIENEGYKWIDGKYKNANSKLLLECSNKHQFYTTFHSFKNSGRRCAACSGKKKYTIEEVKEYLSNYDYELIDTEYINGLTPLLMKCPDGHEIYISFSDFKNSGIRCKYLAKNRKYEYNEIKEHIESFDDKSYELISNTYENVKSELEIKHKACNNIFKISFELFRKRLKNNMCPVCSNYVNKYTIQDVQQYLKKFNYTVVDNIYTGCNENLLVKCDNGHIFNTTFSSFKQNDVKCVECKHNTYLNDIRTYVETFDFKLLNKKYIKCDDDINIQCIRCGNKIKISSKTLSEYKNSNKDFKNVCKHCLWIEKYNNFKKMIGNDGYTLLSPVKDFKNIFSKVLISCPNINHEPYYITPSSFKRGQRCMKCYNEYRGNTLKLNYSDVVKMYENDGYIVKSNEYINSSTKIETICPNGHIYWSRPTDFKAGYRCKSCYLENCRTSNQFGENNHNWNPDREYIKKRKRVHRISKNMIRRCLAYTDKIKTTKTEQLLGYSRTQLLEHLNKFSLWTESFNNINVKVHIDHIIPVKAFIEHEIYDLSIINHLSNLQVLTEHDNVSKSDSYREEDFQKYIEQFKLTETNK